MSWIIKTALPGGSTFKGQIVYDTTTIEVPDSLIRYIESVSIREANKYITKLTGGEATKHKVAYVGTDMDTEISIVLIGKLPRYYFSLFYMLANAINQGGMPLYFKDTFASDYQYTCRWVNAVSFAESDVLFGGCTLELSSWEKQSL